MSYQGVGKASRPRWLKLTIIGGLTAAVLVGVYFWTTSMGRGEVLKVAQDNFLCEDAACAAGIARVYETGTKQFGMSPALIDWCLGTDDWAQAKVYRGAWVRDLAVAIMDLPCGPLMNQSKTLPSGITASQQPPAMNVGATAGQQ